MSVERILSQDRNIVARSMDHIVSIQKLIDKVRKSRKMRDKNCELEEYVTKYDTVCELARVPSRLSIV